MPPKAKKVVTLSKTMDHSEDDANSNDVNVNTSQEGIENAPVVERTKNPIISHDEITIHNMPLDSDIIQEVDVRAPLRTTNTTSRMSSEENIRSESNDRTSEDGIELIECIECQSTFDANAKLSKWKDMCETCSENIAREARDI